MRSRGQTERPVFSVGLLFAGDNGSEAELIMFLVAALAERSQSIVARMKVSALARFLGAVGLESRTRWVLRDVRLHVHVGTPVSVPRDPGLKALVSHVLPEN